MKYAIIVAESEQELAARQDLERVEAYWAAYHAYTAALSEAGILRSGAGLEPPMLATTLRVREGQRQVQDGPFADTKEKLGGFFVIEVDDLDAALEWAARCPAASTGAIEVRPLLAPSPGRSPASAGWPRSGRGAIPAA